MCSTSHEIVKSDDMCGIVVNQAVKESGIHNAELPKGRVSVQGGGLAATDRGKHQQLREGERETGAAAFNGGVNPRKEAAKIL